MTTSQEINQWLIFQKDYLGCFAHNKLPIFPKKFPKYLIVNTSGRKNGGHWVALLILNKDQILYFDSFGRRVTNENIKKFVSNCNDLFFNSTCLQHMKSKLCGLFCILFVKLVKNKKDYKNFLKCFNNNVNLRHNDKIVVRMLKKS